ncbi:MAG: YfiR family protein [Acidobacteriota bacterium]
MAFLIRRLARAATLLAAVLAAIEIAPAESPSEPAPAPPLESQVRAAFVYNFAKFIDWPQSVSMTPDGVFVIGVLGDTPVLAALHALSGQEVKGRRLVVRQYQRPSEAACQVLYVGAGQIHAFAEAARSFRELPILTVGEGDEFLKAGGMIALVQIEGRVRYRIRAEPAETARLVISSKLLKLAERPAEQR